MKLLSILQYSDYREYLRDYAAFMKQKNRHWSYSIWSRRLGIASKSTLTMIMQGRRSPGPELTEKFVSSFDWNSDEAQHFRRLVAAQKKTTTQLARLEMLRVSGSSEKRRVWLHLVLKELRCLPDFRADPDYIQRKLLLAISKDEVMRTLSEAAQSASDLFEGQAELSEEEIIRFHEDGSQASTEAVWRVSAEERVFLTSILKVSRERLPEAKIILRETQKKLGQLLENEQGEGVYELHLHLFPLTKS